VGQPRRRVRDDAVVLVAPASLQGGKGALSHGRGDRERLSSLVPNGLKFRLERVQ
jgi:hypothetical protein